MNLDAIRDLIGRDLTRDEERHLEVLAEFGQHTDLEGCDGIVRSSAARSHAARAWCREFGWCTTCRKRTARTGLRTCSVCAASNAAYQRSPGGRATHAKAMVKQNAKRRRVLP